MSEYPKDWCMKMAELEAGHEVGAGDPNHPLRTPMTTESRDALVELRRTIYLRMTALGYLDDDSLDQLIDTFFPDAVLPIIAAERAAVWEAAAAVVKREYDAWPNRNEISEGARNACRHILEDIRAQAASHAPKDANGEPL